MRQAANRQGGLRTVARASAILIAVLLAYLLIVAAWAWASYGDAVRTAPPAPTVELSSRQTAILLQVEDPTFYQHAGLSVAPGQGMATMTGAVARDLFLFGARLDGIRGGLQGFYRAVFTCCKRIDVGRDAMALVLNARMPKRDQLAWFTANVYMGANGGQPVRGLAQAARVYLGKPLALATEPEFIRLVAMIKAPDLYHPSNNPAALDARARRIEALVEGRCAPQGWLDTTYASCDVRAAPAPASD